MYPNASTQEVIKMAKLALYREMGTLEMKIAGLVVD